MSESAKLVKGHVCLCRSDGLTCSEEVVTFGYDDGICRVKLKIGSLGVCPRFVPVDKRRAI